MLDGVAVRAAAPDAASAFAVLVAVTHNNMIQVRPSCGKLSLKQGCVELSKHIEIGIKQWGHSFCHSTERWMWWYNCQHWQCLYS